MSKNIHATQDWVRDNVSIKPIASGELISLSDSAEAPLQSMKIFGKTEQFTTTGKNKLPYPYSDTSHAEQGIEFTDNGDGSITANGTATNNAYFRLKISANDYTLPAGEYILSGCPQDGSATTYYLYISIPDLSTINDLGKGIRFTLDSDTKITVFIRIVNGQTVSNVTFYPMIRPADIIDATWEPYTGGIPSPNPDYPQEFVSVGDSGSTTEYVMGGNLFNNDTSLLKEVTYKSADGVNRKIGYEPLQLPAGTYTFTLTELNASDGKYVYGSINDKDGNFVQSCSLLQNTKNLTPLTITVNDGDKIYIYDGYRTINDAKNLTFSKVQIQLNVGSTATPYEPYKEQSLTIPTPNGLPGIPVSSGGNYTDSNGQQYVCDEVDFGRGVYVQRVKKKILTGSESWSLYSTGLGSYSTFEKTSCFTLYNIPNKIVGLKTSMCNTFKNVPTTPFMGNAAESGMYTDHANSINLYFAWGGVNQTLADWTAFIAEKYAAGTPVEILYILAEPIETPLTEEEIQAYKALHTNYPNTTIYNSDGAGAEVKYLADTKNYIDNKFAELQANILKATE